jgi:hypothetical protein
VIVDQGNFEFNPYSIPSITRVGNCTDGTEGDLELYVFSYFNISSNFNYTLYQPGQSNQNGFIQEGTYDILNIDELDCNIFVHDALGRVGYFVVQNGKTIDRYVQSEYKAFGKCVTKTCPNQSILIMNKDNETSFFYNLTGNEEILDSGYVTTADSICFDYNKCNEITGNGTATYFFFEGDQIYDSGFSTDYFKIGDCEQICDHLPILSTTSRGKDIVIHLATISGMSALNDVATFQYKAACWIIYDDIKNLNASSPNLVQRYVLGLFYIATNGLSWTESKSFLSGKYECDWGSVSCNSNGFVSHLSLSK